MLQKDKIAHEMLKQQVHDMAKFPEVNPNPVLRVGDTGEVLFANAAARTLPGLLENNGSRLAHEMGVEVAAAYAARQNHQVEFASGDRQFAFVVTPVPGGARSRRSAERNSGPAMLRSFRRRTPTPFCG
jgi:hypothetical protein